MGCLRGIVGLCMGYSKGIVVCAQFFIGWLGKRSKLGKEREKQTEEEESPNVLKQTAGGYVFWPNLLPDHCNLDYLNKLCS